MLATPRTIGRSIGLFAIVTFMLPFLAAIWLDSVTVDGTAVLLLVLSAGITNKKSIRCGVLAQAVSLLYGLAYAVAAILLCFLPDSFPVRPGWEISLVFRILAVPVSIGIAGWAFWNVATINPFVKGRTMHELEENRAEPGPATPVTE